MFCRNTWVMTTQREANERLLLKWKYGNWKWGHTVYCAQHRGFHLGVGLRG